MTFTSDSSAAMKHIKDLSPKFGVEEMEMVNKGSEEVQEEEMDQGDRLTEWESRHGHNRAQGGGGGRRG